MKRYLLSYLRRSETGGILRHHVFYSPSEWRLSELLQPCEVLALDRIHETPDLTVIQVTGPNPADSWYKAQEEEVPEKNLEILTKEHLKLVQASQQLVDRELKDGEEWRGDRES